MRVRPVASRDLAATQRPGGVVPTSAMVTVPGESWKASAEVTSVRVPKRRKK